MLNMLAYIQCFTHKHSWHSHLNFEPSVTMQHFILVLWLPHLGGHTRPAGAVSMCFLDRTCNYPT